MAERTLRLLSALAVGATIVAPSLAGAQTSTYYTPPKIIKQGSSSAPIVGAGAVTVKVFVKKNGSVGTVQVTKSTNPGDDQAASEIAKTSTYKPGLR
ncbi:MAG: hypothetical protein JO103_12730, partial [Candidatus Eremiobacteraeota bacterium]|nr:hypothetical protein [Candidatus Eremiobacteraeota bacterium]